MGKRLIEEKGRRRLSATEDEEDYDVQRKPQRQVKKPKPIAIICIVVGLIFFTASIILGINTAATGIKATSDAYETAKTVQVASVYQSFYQNSYDTAEAKYHVSNDVTINIGGLKEESKLEVLKVSDVEYMIQEEKDGVPVLSLIQDAIHGDVTTWLEVPGDGTFIVNLQAGEFIIDNERQYVLIRVPAPELNEIEIDYANTQLLEFDKNGKSSTKDGEDLVREQLQSASSAIEKAIQTNQRFYQSAKESAVNILTRLVQELNPEADNLTVEVEFIE